MSQTHRRWLAAQLLLSVFNYAKRNFFSWHGSYNPRAKNNLHSVQHDIQVRTSHKKNLYTKRNKRRAWGKIEILLWCSQRQRDCTGWFAYLLSTYIIRQKWFFLQTGHSLYDIQGGISGIQRDTDTALRQLKLDLFVGGHKTYNQKLTAWNV